MFEQLFMQALPELIKLFGQSNTASTSAATTPATIQPPAKEGSAASAGKASVSDASTQATNNPQADILTGVKDILATIFGGASGSTNSQKSSTGANSTKKIDTAQSALDAAGQGITGGDSTMQLLQAFAAKQEVDKVQSEFMQKIMTGNFNAQDMLALTKTRQNLASIKTGSK